MKTNFPYDSVYQYLDKVFANTNNPTKEQIILAKKQYRRLYLDAYQKQRRTRIREYTLGLDAKTINGIHQQRGDLSVSEFLYDCLFQKLEVHSELDRRLINTVHTQQLEIIVALEEVLAIEDTEAIELILEKLEVLIKTFQKLMQDDY